MNTKTAPQLRRQAAGPTSEKQSTDPSGPFSIGHSADIVEDDPMSNLCDVGAHAWCNGVACSCACHRVEYGEGCSDAAA